MIEKVKPLKDCIARFRDRIAADYDVMPIERLTALILDAETKIFFETTESSKTDAMRAVVWFANAALTRKGLAPSARTSLGTLPKKVTRQIHLIRKQDGPYYDLQWLGFRHPELIPKKWQDIKFLATTAPGRKETDAAAAANDGDDIAFSTSSPDELLDTVFDAADRLINRKFSIARKCQTLKLSPAIQSEMRWLCSASTRKLLKDLGKREIELRVQMERQNIKQLKAKHIDRRVMFFRAWKLAGGGTNWQATADVFASMTGEKVTRQAIKDMITRLGHQKLVRLKRGRKRTHDPLLGGE